MAQKIFITFFILFLAFITRFYLLGSAPAGLYLDEAGQGYSAYSLLKTGADEFGKTFPIIFRSFTDFKTPVYIYLIVPLIPVFGLTPLAVRLPSAVFSLLTFPVLFYLCYRLTRNYRLSAISCLLLAISPWHILFGRTNFECNVALFFLLTGILYFYKALQNPKHLYLSALMFAIAVPAYHSQRIITPLVVLFLVFSHRHELLATSYKPYLKKAFLIGLLISLPTLSVLNTPGFLARASTLNIFANQSFLSAIREFFSLYFSYLSPRNMFFLGDYGPRSSFPQLSTFFFWQLPFYFYGLYKLLKSKIVSHISIFLFLLLVSPIPAALTRDPYSSIRALPLVIPQIFIISYGIYFYFKNLKSYLLSHISLLIFPILIIFSLGKLYSSGIILNEYHRASYWDYGWNQVANVLKTRPAGMPVVVDSARNEPYIHLLFFLKFDPQTYVRDNFEVDPADYYTDLSRLSVRKIGNISVRGINWTEDSKIDQYLVGDVLAISEDQIKRHQMELISVIKYPDGSPVFRIAKTAPDK